MTTEILAVPASQATIVFPAEPKPLAYVRLGADNTVTVISKQLDMGQGIHTELVTLVAEELDAAVDQMRVESAPAEPGVTSNYGNVLMGGIQGTGGQTGTQSSYMIYRMAGAAMRRMILSAAAVRLNVDESRLSIRQGVVSDSVSGLSLGFGDLALDAMASPVPEHVVPKPSADFVFIGKHFPRIDGQAKVHGETRYTQDIKLPGMLVAVIARPTRLGTKLISFDATEALKMEGIEHVVATEFGVAVVASDFWSAYQARSSLKIEWDSSQALRIGSPEISVQLRGLLDQPGIVALDVGETDSALAGAARRFAADYEVPYHAHAPMETMNGVMQRRGDRIEMWGVSQVFGFDSIFIAQAAGIPMENIKVNQLPVGGSFGRRYGPKATTWLELLSIIGALDTDRPIKLMYSREDDFTVASTFYRPGYCHRIEAGVDASGKLVAWKHRVAGQSMLVGTMMARGLINEAGVDYMSVESSVDSPYRIPNQFVDLHSPSIGFNVSPTRDGGTYHNGFANESMMDEVARAVGADALQYRLDLLPAGNRERGCLELVAAKAGWSKPMSPTGVVAAAGSKRGRGIAVIPSHRSYGAAIVEVTVAADSSYTVDRVVIAIDCGMVINPDNLEAQMEGGIGFGLGLARYGSITFKDGEAEQFFYTDYHIARMHTMPKIEAYFVRSTEGPSGAGETIGSAIAPALANALFDACGIRLRSTPLRLPDEPVEEWDQPSRLNTFKGAQASTLA
ncbi:xanthine dehydrogenase family protein molybdopterin-binding subunit [soil metagenome]